MSPRLRTGTRPRAPRGLRADLARRIAGVHAVLRAAEAGLLVAVCGGAPSEAGWARYLTCAPMWGQRAFVIVDPTRVRRTLITRSPDDANWLRETSIDTDVESVLTRKITTVDALAAHLRERVGAAGRVGVINIDLLTPAETAVIRTALPSLDLVDLTAPMNRLRRVKTGYETAMLRQTDALLSDALDLVPRLALRGRPVAKVSGEIDAFLRANGCGAGETSWGLDGRVSPVRAPLDRTLAAGEVFLVHLAYAGPGGYWVERSAVFALGPLAPDEARLIDAASCALDRAARAAAAGTRAAAVHAAVVAAYGECGFGDAESYDLHIHPIGTDEDEHAAGSAGDWELEHGCVVALHPAVRLRGGRGYYLARTYAVEAGGAAPLTPAGRAIREVTSAAPEMRPSN